MSRTVRKMPVIAVLLGLGAAGLLNSAAVAQSAGDRAGSIRIIDAWAPPSAGSQRTGAVYFTMINEGPSEDRLAGVSTDGAGLAALHTNIIKDNVVRMRPIDGVTLPAGSTIILKPGGMHLMLYDMSAPLVSGTRLGLNLQFARAGKISIDAVVRDAQPGAAQPHPSHEE